jgi:hypothetical protein
MLISSSAKAIRLSSSSRVDNAWFCKECGEKTSMEKVKEKTKAKSGTIRSSTGTFIAFTGLVALGLSIVMLGNVSHAEGGVPNVATGTNVISRASKSSGVGIKASIVPGAITIQVILKGESYQIDKYNKLTKKYHTKDLVTHEIFEGLLVNEVSDEEDWESFIPGLQQKQKQR